jgi:hypothetical protein
MKNTVITKPYSFYFFIVDSFCTTQSYRPSQTPGELVSHQLLSRIGSNARADLAHLQPRIIKRLQHRPPGTWSRSLLGETTFKKTFERNECFETRRTLARQPLAHPFRTDKKMTSAPNLEIARDAGC